MPEPWSITHGGILSGLLIKKAVDLGLVTIDPWEPTYVNVEDRVNPASYDLTLGPLVAVYKDVVHADFDCMEPSPGVHQKPSLRHFGRDRPGVPGERLSPRSAIGNPYPSYCLDAAKENETATFRMDWRGFLLKPGILYLMHTQERILTDSFVPIVDGKSSLGRLGITAHVTAGYGDPGFDGQYTLEVVTAHPAIIYPGMRFCQMRFHTLVGEVESYAQKGSYRDRLAEGPVPSQSWRSFRPEKTGHPGPSEGRTD